MLCTPEHLATIKRMQESNPKLTLYMMVGYPGSGKTTASRIIHDLTGAEHIWADHERKSMFGAPTHSRTESRMLYERLNAQADDLLKEGKSVIFDTNFNFYKDREYMRRIAAKNNAKTMLVWIQTPKEVAFARASIDVHKQATRVLGDIPKAEFDRMTHNLQPPQEDEHPVILDGTQITPQYVREKLELQQ
jgi:predicted kinase